MRTAAPRGRSGTRSRSRARARQEQRRRAVSSCTSPFSSERSESLEILEQGPLLLVREVRAEGRALVARVVVAGLEGVEAEEGAIPLRGGFIDKADVDRIVDIRAAVKDLGPSRGRLEQFAQIGDRAIVQVRCAQPDPVERRVGVAEGLAKVSEPLGIRLLESPILLVAGVESALVDGQGPRVGVEAMTVGADPLDRHHGADELVCSRRAVTEGRFSRAVTTGTVLT